MEASHHNPRMHVGGKLSFRRRVRQVEDGDDLVVFGGEDPPPLERLVAEGYDRVEVEIGPGKGAFLLAACEARPDTFFVGIEAAPGYAKHAAARLRKLERDNAVFLVDNGKLYLQDRVPDRAIARLHVYYPDPWPKRRHKGRRFFTEDVCDTLARVVDDGGWLLTATDNAAYAGQICRVLGSCQAFARDEAEEHRLLEGPPGHGFSPTSFEQKYAEEGRVLRRYAWRRLPR